MVVVPDFSRHFPKTARKARAARPLEKSSKKQSVMQAGASRTLFCSITQARFGSGW